MLNIKSPTKLRDMASLVSRHIKRYWAQSLLLVVLGIAGALLTSIQPILLAPALDISLSSFGSPAATLTDLNLNNIGATLAFLLGVPESSDPIRLVIAVASLFLAVGILAAAVNFLAHMLSSWINVNANCDLQLDLYKHLLNLDFKFFQKNKTNELTSRFINDVGEVTVSLDVSMRQGLESLVQIMIYGFLLFKTSTNLALLVVGVSGFHFLINRYLRYRVQRSTSDRFDKLADTGTRLGESFTNIRIIKSFSKELFENAKFKRLIDSLRKISMRFSLYKHTELPLRKITDSIALAVVLVFSFKSMQQQDLTASGFLLFMIVVRQTIAPMSVFAQSLIRLYGGLGSARRVIELLETKPSQNRGNVDLNKFAKSINFKDVSFTYDGQYDVLENINFELRRGEVLAVVGPSGAGKSTLADLLVRLYDPSQGVIVIDDIPINDYSLMSYRGLFGVVPQEGLLNHLSVEENVAYGDDMIVESRLWHALAISNSKEFVEALPKKAKTLIGDRGVLLSGGQRQRLAIARAIYSNPEILILDEATSALDSESEQAVQIAIDKVLKNSTAFIIAHRLSTIMHADRIIVINQGKVEAIGTNEELLRLSPTYKKLYNIQFGI